MLRQQRRFADVGIGGFVSHWYDNNTKRHRLKDMRSYAEEVSKFLS